MRFGATEEGWIVQRRNVKRGKKNKNTEKKRKKSCAGKRDHFLVVVFPLTVTSLVFVFECRDLLFPPVTPFAGVALLVSLNGETMNLLCVDCFSSVNQNDFSFCLSFMLEIINR